MTKQQINILVTGGAGNIGTNHCNELRSRGHKVIACNLYNTEHKIKLDVMCEITDSYSMYSMFLVHLILSTIWLPSMVGEMVKFSMNIFGYSIA